MENNNQQVKPVQDLNDQEQHRREKVSYLQGKRHRSFRSEIRC